MEHIYIILIALSLSLIAYSTAFWGGVYRCLCVQEIIKMAIAFSLFQLGMFWIGNWSGSGFANSMGWLSVPFAEAIILLTGVKLIYGTIRLRPEQKSYNLAKNVELIAVSFASSLNAFMLGLGIGLLMPVSDLMLYSILFGVAAFSVLGNFMGKKSGKIYFTKSATLISGSAMIVLAVILALDLYDII
jgi:putative Mn2+ efflux pump MntP